MSKQQDYSQLIADCIDGKRAAQHRLFKLFYSKLFHLCYRYAQNKDEAQDMLNEGFIKIFENLHKYKPEGSFEAWLKRVMVNAALDYQRRYCNHAEVSMEDLQELSWEGVDQNAAISKLSSDELMMMIQQLPPTSKAVFNLYVFEGYSHTEIAEMLDMKEGTSHWHLNFARTKLKMMILAQ